MMNRDDTIEAFVCCTQIPPDCTNCPEKGPTGELGRNCKSDVKTSVYHWLVVQEPVVRCKDCKYCYFASNRVPAERAHVCSIFGYDVALDFNCKNGERRDGDV